MAFVFERLGVCERGVFRAGVEDRPLPFPLVGFGAFFALRLRESFLVRFFELLSLPRPLRELDLALLLDRFPA